MKSDTMKICKARQRWPVKVVPVMLMFLASTHAAAPAPGAPLHVMRSATLERRLRVRGTPRVPR